MKNTIVPTVMANVSVSLKRQIIRELVLEGEGQFVTIEWITKTGTTTKANGRAGVKKYLVKDCDRKRAKSDKPACDHILTIYKLGKGYRSVSLDNVISIKAKGQKVYFT